eukprot:TRINITY_DN488_c2_g1_i1.p1 TRINITY_DN488_c2_g1~~TRINITY_DN488_c2_g1_i1.p1  ORF type:complete len:150 (+),score=47.72 TRINITY_DN488_c2_g1_i1:57-506(+)
MPLSTSQIKETFGLFDADGSGAIDKEELALACKGLGLSLDATQIDEMLQKIDKDGNSIIEVDEFEKMIRIKEGEMDSTSEVKKAFDLFGENSPTLTAEHFERVAQQIGIEFDAEKTALFIKEASNGAGSVNLNQWNVVHGLPEEEPEEY